MISEGSCDTEDWSNDAENSALPSQNKFYFKIYSNRNNYNYSQYSCFYCILIVGEHKTSFKSIIKITYQPQTFEQQCMVTPKLQTTIIREILLAM